MIPAQSLLSNGTEDPSSSSTNLDSLPAELRLKIWCLALEPRVVLFGDVVQNHGSYPLPPVTQLNAEARTEIRQKYDHIGSGSYFDFSRDILVCDHKIPDQLPDPFLEGLATRVKKLAYWDCFPDDGRVDGPYPYSVYVTANYLQRHSGKIDFARFWFPNLEDLWIVKVGDIDPSWMIHVDTTASYEMRLKELARQFKYWVDENIIEMAPLDLNESEARAVLAEGRCGKVDCHELNQGRNKMVSKVVFIDGKYEAPVDGKEWVRVLPCNVDEDNTRGSCAHVNRMRWMMVERILTFDLRWEGWNEASEDFRRHVRGRK